MPDQGVEIRRIDDYGRLHEEHVHDRRLGSLMAIDSVFPALATAASLIESEIKMLSNQVQTLSSRVDALENQRRPPASPTAQKKIKSTAGRPRAEKEKGTRS
jgi:outer membrane murein-binding lipoprotein Lpp